jgi:hypothetical protein
MCGHIERVLRVWRVRSCETGSDALLVKQPMDAAEKAITRIKHYLWHGNVYQALQTIDMLEGDIENVEEATEVVQKFQKGVYELQTYIENNRAYTLNFGERYRNGDTISTAFVESTVNQVISKRFVKKQSMQCTQR